jgi:hypothetical protein
METKEYHVKDGCIEDCIDSGFDEVIKNLNFDKKIVLDKKGIVQSIDKDAINERLVNKYMSDNDYELDHRDVVRNLIDDIDELFER